MLLSDVYCQMFIVRCLSSNVYRQMFIVRCLSSDVYRQMFIVRCLLSDVFSRLQAMKREIHLRELQLLDAVRRRFMHHQQTLKEAELQRLDDEIERKVSTTTGTPAIPLKVIKC